MIEFESIPNARDLGGIKTVDGKTIRSGMLLRAAYLVNASDNDLERLSREFKVCRVIDLRSEFEVGHMPDKPVPGADYAHDEIVTLNGHLFKGMHAFTNTASCFEEGMARFIMTPAAKMICDGFYVSFVDDPECQESIHGFFEDLLSANGTVLWHCTQGKDRTGLCAALLLLALGVSREDVMYDFLLSNEFYAPDIENIWSWVSGFGGSDEERVCVMTLVGVNEQAFIDALDLIDTKYGGPASFLKNQIHLTDGDILELKKRYLV